VFRDDLLQLDLAALPPAGEGRSYQVWLEQTGGLPLLIGTVAGPAEDGLLVYADPSGANLLVTHDGIAISLEPDPDPDTALRGPIGYAGTVDLAAIAMIRLLHDASPDSPTSTAVLDGLAAQLHHFTSHLSLALEAISGGDLAGARLHSEHVINIIEGRSGAMFGDWNSDGLVQNPGDDFGLLPYMRLLAILSGSPAQQTGTELDPQSPEAIFGDRIVRLIAMTEETRDLMSRIATADLITEVEPLSSEVAAFPVEAETLGVLELAEGLDLTVRVPVMALEP
jgi:hypothetical protein